MGSSVHSIMCTTPQSPPHSSSLSHIISLLCYSFCLETNRGASLKADRLFVMALKFVLWLYYYQTTVCDWDKVNNAFFFIFKCRARIRIQLICSSNFYSSTLLKCICTKKWAVCNFNGERQHNNHNIVIEWNKCLRTCKTWLTTWWRKPCWQVQQ